MTPFEQRCAREDEEDRLVLLAEWHAAHAYREPVEDSFGSQLSEEDATASGNVYRPHGRETLGGSAEYADPFNVQADWTERA